MPLVKKYQEEIFEAWVWEATESLDFFVEQLAILPSAWQRLQKRFKSEQTLREWLASRYLLEQVFDCSYLAFQKTPNGQVYLPQQADYLSISHSDSWVMVARSKYPIGIDIQIENTKLPRIAAKFIRAERLAQLDESPHKNDCIHFLWGMKEALFKAYGLGQVDFRKHLHIADFDLKRQWTTAKIIKEDYEGSYRLFYEEIASYYFCLAIKIND